MRMTSFLPAFFMLSLMSSSAECQKTQAVAEGKHTAIVQTGYGKVCGYIHNGIYTFKGIPPVFTDEFEFSFNRSRGYYKELLSIGTRQND
jgi:para-nitrobenzyl esterase